MKLYQVLLETREGIYSFEVFTDIFDAVSLASEYLYSVVGDEGSFNVGGYDCIGEDDSVVEPQVKLVSKN
jgi:hypothetical protein